MRKKPCSSILFAVLFSALLIAGTCFNGNEAVISAGSVTEVDKVPPTTSHNYDGVWCTSNFSITLTAIDNESDLNETYYKINDEPIKTVSVYGQPLITKESANDTLKYWSVDNAGNQETPKILTDIKLDKTVPKGSITINDGATSTTSTQVKLTLSAEDTTSGVAQMRFFEATYGDWEEYATSKLWTFKPGDAYKTVYVQFRDNAGLVSTAYPATIYFGSLSSPNPWLSSAPEKASASLPENPQENSAPIETAPTPPTTSPTPPTASIADMYFVLVTIGIIIAVIAIGLVIILMLRKRP